MSAGMSQGLKDVENEGFPCEQSLASRTDTFFNF